MELGTSEQNGLRNIIISNYTWIFKSSCFIPPISYVFSSNPIRIIIQDHNCLLNCLTYCVINSILPLYYCLLIDYSTNYFLKNNQPQFICSSENTDKSTKNIYFLIPDKNLSSLLPPNNIENKYRKFQYSMKAKQVEDLTIDDRRLLNVLEIKIYDISQNVQIFTKQLSNNQIKDVAAQTYSIFCQLKPIFEKTGVTFLYQIVRKMQISSVLISSILTEKLDRTLDNQNNLNKQVAKIQQQKIVSQQQIPVQFNKVSILPASARIPKLGGINLYNQSYKRGLEYQQVDDISNIEVQSGKCHVKQSKKFRQNLMESVVRDLENKTDVETDNINDQIKNFMRNYKQNNKISSFISYQKELSEIIDFFKTSQLQAMNYLSKSPKNGNQYAEDYINRINDMEKQIKTKQTQQKSNILQKMKILILRMKEKMTEIQKAYADKNQKLIQYQKSLIKQKTTNGTQTNDGFEKKFKQLQAKVKQTQEKYVILSQLKKDEFNMQDKIYEISHQLKIKTNQAKKLVTIKEEQEEEIQYLKKIIRENKQKFTVSPDIDHKKIKVKPKLFKEMSTSKKNLEEIRTFKILENVKEAQQESQKNNQNLNEMKEARHQKRTKRFQKLAHSSNGVRSSIQASVIEGLQRIQADTIIQSPSNKLKLDRQNDYKKKKSFQQNNYNRQIENEPSENQQIKPSNFKYQLKSKQDQWSKQVEFEAVISQQNLTPKSSHRQSNQNQQINIKTQKTSREVSLNQENQSQDMHQKDQQNENLTHKNFFNSILNNNINLVDKSKQSIFPAKSSKSVQKSSKKRLLLKQKPQNKYSHTIESLNRLAKFHIGQQYNICIQFEKPKPYANLKIQQKACRSERPSYPAAASINQISRKQIKQSNIQNNSKILKFNKTIQNLNNDAKDNVPINKKSFKDLNQGVRQQSAAEHYDNIRSTKVTKQQINQKKQMAIYLNTIKKQKTDQSSSLAKNTKKISKQFSQPQQSPGSRNNYNNIAASVLKLNQTSTNKQSHFKQSQWKIISENVSEDNITIVNYIIDEIQRQNLNVQQFQNIMKVIEEDEENAKQCKNKQIKNANNYQSQLTDGFNNNKFKRNVNETKQNRVRDNNIKQNQSSNIKIKKDSYKNIDQLYHSGKNTIYENTNQKIEKIKFAYLNQSECKRQKTRHFYQQYQQYKYVNGQKFINKQISSNKEDYLCRITPQSLQNIYNTNKKISQKITLHGIQYPLSKASMIKIKQLHCKINKCDNHQSTICQHIQKYMNILKRINDLSVRTKRIFNIPVQRIGENLFQQDQTPTNKQKILINKTKKEPHKTGECTMKYRLPTQQNELLKNRILPTINPSNNCYKAKNKIIR